MRLCWCAPSISIPTLVLLDALHNVAPSCITFVAIFCLQACCTGVALFDFVSMELAISIFVPFVGVHGLAIWDGASNFDLFGVFGSEAFDGCVSTTSFVDVTAFARLSSASTTSFCVRSCCHVVACTLSWEECVSWVICCILQWLVNSWVQYNFHLDKCDLHQVVASRFCCNCMFCHCVNHCFRGDGASYWLK